MGADDPLVVGSAAQRRDLMGRGGRISLAKMRVQGRLAPHRRAYRIARSLHITYGRIVGPLHTLPNVYIIGFPKCGTTSLHAYLAEHPDVHVGLLKEVRYFAHDERYRRGLNWYRANFPLKAQKALHERRTGHRSIVIDASVRYVNHPHAMRRIADVTPDAKFIVLVRDPIERAYSHYRMNVRVSPEVSEELPFAEAIGREESRIAGEYERMERDGSYYSRAYFGYGYARNGCYARWLGTWLEAFPDRVLVLDSNDLKADAQGTTDRVTDFVGIRRRRLHDTRKRNIGDGGDGIDAQTRARLSEYYRRPNAELYRLIGRDLAWD